MDQNDVDEYALISLMSGHQGCRLSVDFSAHSRARMTTVDPPRTILPHSTLSVMVVGPKLSSYIALSLLSVATSR